MAKTLVLTLPYPPSVNHLYRNFRGRSILSKGGRQYHTDSLAAILEQERHRFLGRVALEIRLYMPDRRKRDISNTVKILEDCLTHAGIWTDDEQVDDLRIIRMGVTKPGKAVVTIREL